MYFCTLDIFLICLNYCEKLKELEKCFWFAGFQMKRAHDSALESLETKKRELNEHKSIQAAMVSNSGPLMTMLMGCIAIPGICSIVAEYARTFQGEIVHWLAGHTMAIEAIIVLDCNRIATSSADHAIRVWDMTTGLCLNTFYGHTDQVWSLALGENQLLSGSPDRSAKVWNIDTGECVFTLFHDDWVYAVASVGPYTIATCTSQTLTVWDSKRDTYNSTSLYDGTVRSDHLQVTSMVHFNGALLTFSMGEILMWSLPDLKSSALDDQPNTLYSAMVKVDNNQLLCSDINGAVHLWDVRGNVKRCIKSINTIESLIVSMTIQTPNLAFLSYHDGWLRVYNLDDGQQVHAVFCGAAIDMVVLPNGSLAKSTTGQNANNVCLMV